MKFISSKRSIKSSYYKKTLQMEMKRKNRKMYRMINQKFSQLLSKTRIKVNYSQTKRRKFTLRQLLRKFSIQLSQRVKTKHQKSRQMIKTKRTRVRKVRNSIVKKKLKFSKKKSSLRKYKGIKLKTYMQLKFQVKF